MLPGKRRARRALTLRRRLGGRDSNDPLMLFGDLFEVSLHRMVRGKPSPYEDDDSHQTQHNAHTAQLPCALRAGRLQGASPPQFVRSCRLVHGHLNLSVC